jgi:hypothetical protein
MLAAGEGPDIMLTEHGSKAFTGLPPKFWPRRMRGQRLSLIGSVPGAADILSLEALKEQSSHGIQKPSRRVGQKRFPSASWTAPRVAEK